MVELIYVTAKWCGPCKQMKPIINELETSGINVTTIDADENMSFSRDNGVYAIPTFLIKKDGVIVKRFTGAKDKTTLLQAIEQVSSP